MLFKGTITPFLDLIVLTTGTGIVVAGTVFLVKQPLCEVFAIFSRERRLPCAQPGTSLAAALPDRPAFFAQRISTNTAVIHEPIAHKFITAVARNKAVGLLRRWQSRQRSATRLLPDDPDQSSARHDILVD